MSAFITVHNRDGQHVFEERINVDSIRWLRPMPNGTYFMIGDHRVTCSETVEEIEELIKSAESDQWARHFHFRDEIGGNP